MHHAEKEDCSKNSENLERKEKPTSSHMNKPKNWKKTCLYIFKKNRERNFRWYDYTRQ